MAAEADQITTHAATPPDLFGACCSDNSPTIPAELWALWTGFSWLPSFDANPGHADPVLVFFSEREAIDGAKYQQALYDIDTVAVRIK